MEINRDLLILVVDLNPAFWGGAPLSTTAAASADRDVRDLPRFLQTVLALSNAHQLLSESNQLVILGVTPHGAEFLHPALPDESGSSSSTSAPADAKYEPLARMNQGVREAMSRLASKIEEHPLSSCMSLAGAIGKALCYISRHRQDDLACRILVLKGSPDDPHQYMSFMNTVFTAQKMQVPVDACLLSDANSGGGLLLQAADITGGLCLNIPRSDALLQYLLTVFLPPVRMRDALVLPSAPPADYRAACFCHRRLIDVGYVCSVCLSVYCTFSPICTTCNTVFKMAAPPTLPPPRKKQKKNNSTR